MLFGRYVVYLMEMCIMRINTYTLTNTQFHLIIHPFIHQSNFWYIR